MTAGARTFKFVFVPADVSEPLAEWQLSYTKENEIDCLFARLKACSSAAAQLSSLLTVHCNMTHTHVQEHFARAKPARSADQLQAYRQQLLQNVPKEQQKALTDEVMAMATDLNMVRPAAAASCAVCTHLHMPKLCTRAGGECGPAGQRTRQ